MPRRRRRSSSPTRDRSPSTSDAADRVARVLDDAELIERVLVRRVEAATDAAAQARFLEQLGAVLQERRGDAAAAAGAWKRAAAAWLHVGDDEQARALYAQVRALFPDDRESASALVLLHETAQSFAPIPELLEALLRDDDDPRRGARVLAAADPDPRRRARAPGRMPLPRRRAHSRPCPTTARLLPCSSGWPPSGGTVATSRRRSTRSWGPSAGSSETPARWSCSRPRRGCSRPAPTPGTAPPSPSALLLGSPALDDARRRAAVLAFERLLVQTPTRDAFEHRRWLFSLPRRARLGGGARSRSRRVVGGGGGGRLGDAGGEAGP